MGKLHLAVNVLFEATSKDWLPARLVFYFFLLWTLAPRVYVTYCQAQGLSGHTSPCGKCVCFNLEDFMTLEVEEDYLPFS